MSASKKLRFSDGLALLDRADHLYWSKGKKAGYFDLTRVKPDEEELRKMLLGPTGNLRSPTVLKGRTLLVGFNQDQYSEVFG